MDEHKDPRLGFGSSAGAFRPYNVRRAGPSRPDVPPGRLLHCFRESSGVFPSEAAVRNPWLGIPAEDYEAHMASPEVAQAQALDGILGDALEAYGPPSLAVLGCATGNGFRHIDPKVTGRVVAVDINGDYIEILKTRHAARIPNLETVVADFTDPAFRIEPVSLVFAGLVFEYVDVTAALDRMSRILSPEAVLVAVLQRPSPHSPCVTPTPYRSLERLAPILRLVDPEVFSSACRERGLVELRTGIRPLKKGKSFFVGHYRNSP